MTHDEKAIRSDADGKYPFLPPTWTGEIALGNGTVFRAEIDTLPSEVLSIKIEGFADAGNFSKLVPITAKKVMMKFRGMKTTDAYELAKFLTDQSARRWR